MFISSCTQSRSDFFLLSWFEVYRDFGPPLEAPWRNSANWFNSCLVPLSVPTVNRRKCLRNSAGKLVNKGEEGLGHRPFAFLVLFVFPSSPSHFTTVRRAHHPQSPKEEKEKAGAASLAIYWTWSLWQPHSGLELRPSFELEVNRKSVLFCFVFFSIGRQAKCFGECGRPLWTDRASSGSVVPSPHLHPDSYSSLQISESLVFGGIIANYGNTWLTVTSHRPAFLANLL